ncbi:MAG: sulfotransferase [Candidatus Omnitrophica bacterium]|nr:sulfotransferase [Candidatus Omnitrophota bacterium]
MTRQLREFIFYCFNQISVELQSESMLSLAERKTGLNDWGNLAFREPLDVLLEALRREAKLSQRGRFVVAQHYMRLLCNILKIVDDWKRHPEIAHVPVEAPIVILGFPRTGTTYLHSLLSRDPAFRTMQYWELLFPSPPPDPAAHRQDPRKRQARRFAFFIGKISPKLSAIHELSAEAVEECCFIFDHFFLDNIHHLVFDIPSYIEWYDKHDALPSYRFHRRMLQYYGWKFSFERYALKAPRHLFCLKDLLAVYPGAMIVWTHRNPESALPSLCSLSETARRIISDDIDNRRIGRLCLDHFDKDFKAGWAARKNFAPGQFYDVPYRELVHDPIGVVQKIYRHFNLSYTEELDANLCESISHAKKQPREKHRYSLEQFGLHRDAIHERLRDYYDHFGKYC